MEQGAEKVEEIELRRDTVYIITITRLIENVDYAMKCMAQEMTIQQQLYNLQDKKYAAFQAKLTPTVPEELFIGVRVPQVRKLAKAIYKEEDFHDFLAELPHKFYDENMLQGLIISEYKRFDDCVVELEKFLPYVDNWAVCDIMSPKCFKKNKTELLEKIRQWTASNHVYTCRFGVGMLMSHFLDDDFKPEYLEIPAGICSDEYYINMMIAWFYATALAKQWDATIGYITENRLGDFVHNKTIQKARESYRITDEQKEYLNKFKR